MGVYPLSRVISASSGVGSIFPTSTSLASPKSTDQPSKPWELGFSASFASHAERVKAVVGRMEESQDILTTAQDGLGQIQGIVKQMRERASNASNATLQADERERITKELAADAKRIDAIVSETRWGGKRVLDGLKDFGGSLEIPLGTNAGEKMKVNGYSLRDASVRDGSLRSLAQGGNVAVSNDSQRVLSGTSFALGTVSAGKSELENGTYNVRVTYDGTMGNKSSVSLEGADGQVLATKTDVDLSSDSGLRVDFENGLRIDVRGFASAGTESEPVRKGQSYTASVEYERYNVDVSTADKAAAYVKVLDAKLGALAKDIDRVDSINNLVADREDLLMENQLALENVIAPAAGTQPYSAGAAMQMLKLQILQQTLDMTSAHANVTPESLISLFQRARDE